MNNRGNPEASKPIRRRPPRIVDLHDKAMDATGRVDVLVARSLRLAVDRSNDPIIKLWYSQLQPDLDATIQNLLGKLKLKRTLRSLGLTPAPAKRRPRAGRRRQPDL